MKVSEPKGVKPKKPRTPKDGPNVHGGSQEARRVAALVLEVLAGVSRPSQAARMLGVTLPRYYQLELRGLEGLVRACEPVAKGPRTDLQKEVAKLERRVRQLENDCLRYQSLARAAGRAVGLTSSRDDKKAGDGKRKCKPTIRALKVAKVLKPEAPQEAPLASDANKEVKCG